MRCDKVERSIEKIRYRKKADRGKSSAMKIKIISVGSLKEKYWLAAESEYLKRLSAYAKVEICEIKEQPLAANASTAQISKSVGEEGCELLKKNTGSAKVYRIALDSKGKDLSSEEFAELLSTRAARGQSEIHFFIGGSNGLSGNVIDAADQILSFGKKTFPHQLMRIILLEQVYRCFKINASEPYHK